jgi:hypothetical protein
MAFTASWGQSARPEYDENGARCQEYGRERSGGDVQHAEPADECDKGKDQAERRQIDERVPLAGACTAGVGEGWEHSLRRRHRGCVRCAWEGTWSPYQGSEPQA